MRLALLALAACAHARTEAAPPACPEGTELVTAEVVQGGAAWCAGPSGVRQGPAVWVWSPGGTLRGQHDAGKMAGVWVWTDGRTRLEVTYRDGEPVEPEQPVTLPDGTRLAPIDCAGFVPERRFHCDAFLVRHAACPDQACREAVVDAILGHPDQRAR